QRDLAVDRGQDRRVVRRDDRHHERVRRGEHGARAVAVAVVPGPERDRVVAAGGGAGGGGEGAGAVAGGGGRREVRERLVGQRVERRQRQRVAVGVGDGGRHVQRLTAVDADVGDRRDLRRPVDVSHRDRDGDLRRQGRVVVAGIDAGDRDGVVPHL